MVKFTHDGKTGFAVSGMDGRIPMARWIPQLRRAAFAIQQRIADGYRASRVAGTRWLLPARSPQYIRWKLRQVGHNRRGHLFEGIQTVLDTVTLWTLAPLKGKAIFSTRVNFSETLFRDQLVYIKPYERSKVPGGRILQLAASWVAAQEAILRAWEVKTLEAIEASRASTPGRGGASGAARKIKAAADKQQRVRDVVDRAARRTR